MRWVESLPDDAVSADLADAAYWLVAAISDGWYDRRRALAIAAAIIRNHRKSLGTKSRRAPDFPDDWSDEKLIWRALTAVSCVGLGSVVPAPQLRTAEAALRTMWKRGQS